MASLNQATANDVFWLLFINMFFILPIHHLCTPYLTRNSDLPNSCFPEIHNGFLRFLPRPGGYEILGANSIRALFLLADFSAAPISQYGKYLVDLPCAGYGQRLPVTKKQSDQFAC